MEDCNYSDDKFLMASLTTLPAVGMGTYRIQNRDILYQTIDNALQVGYRSFDTAAVHGNEQFLGEIFHELLPKYELEREDIFITTKLAPTNHGAHYVEKALDKSLDNLGIDYVDLYLINFPGAARIKSRDMRNRRLRHESWREMIHIYEQGKALAIGVSNFTIDHLEKLCDFSEVIPHVNQVEWHPYYFQPNLLDYCKSNVICLQAYSSFGGLSCGQEDLLNEPIVKDIARKHKVTEHQVLLLWALQNKVAVIPKSVTPYRIKKNFELYIRLTREDITALDSLNKNFKYAWDPSAIP